MRRKTRWNTGKIVNLSEDFVVRRGCVHGPPSDSRISGSVEGIVGHHSTPMQVGWQDEVVVLNPLDNCQSLWFYLWPKHIIQRKRKSERVAVWAALNMLLGIYSINHFNTRACLNFEFLLHFFHCLATETILNYSHFFLYSLFLKPLNRRHLVFFSPRTTKPLCAELFFSSSSPSLFYSLYSHSKHFISIFPPCFNFKTTPLLNNKKTTPFARSAFWFSWAKNRNCWASLCPLCCFATTSFRQISNTTVHFQGALLCWLDFWSSRLNLKVITHFSFPYKYMFYDINVVTCSAWTEQAHDQLNSFSELQQ